MQTLGGLPEVQTWRSARAIFWEPGPAAWLMGRRQEAAKPTGARKRARARSKLSRHFRWPGRSMEPQDRNKNLLREGSLIASLILRTARYLEAG